MSTIWLERTTPRSRARSSTRSTVSSSTSSGADGGANASGLPLWVASSKLSDSTDGKTRLRILAARFAPELCRTLVPLEVKRAQGRPGAGRTRGLVCKKRKRTRAYRFDRGDPAFPAQWFYGL